MKKVSLLFVWSVLLVGVSAHAFLLPAQFDMRPGFVGAWVLNSTPVPVGCFVHVDGLLADGRVFQNTVSLGYIAPGLTEYAYITGDGWSPFVQARATANCWWSGYGY